MRKVFLIIALCFFLIGCNSINEEKNKTELTINSPDIYEAFYEVEAKIEKDNKYRSGSNIEDINLTDINIDNLTLLGKIWGFLKYYHPYVAKGEYKWDYELFRILPRILDLESTSQRDEILYMWIESLGEYEVGRYTQEKLLDIKVSPDLNWIEDPSLKQELVTKLSDIKKARRRLTNHYTKINPYSPYPILINEKPYPEMKYSDAGYRLLSLYRYWNIIEYYFPYKYLIGEDWDSVLKEFIPKFINASNELEYQLVVLELITKTNDLQAGIEESKILDSFWGINYSPVKVEFIEGKLVVTEYYDKELGEQSGLKIGDVIRKINNKTVEDLITEMEPYIPATNKQTKLRAISRDILRTNEESLKIDLIRNNESILLELKCYPKKHINSNISEFDRIANSWHADEVYKVIDSNIGYIYPGLFKSEDGFMIRSSIMNTKGLIIDFRCYSKENLLDVISYFLFPETTEFAKLTVVSGDEPGLFSFTNENLKIGVSNDEYYKGKVVIIINELTQSQLEYAAMALRKAPNVTIIGSNSAGANGDLLYFYLPGSIYTRITNSGVYYIDGEENQRKGIEPDIVVKPTIDGIKAGRDELLEKAIEIINEDIK